MTTEPPPAATTATTTAVASATSIKQQKRCRSIFELPDNFFDACRLLSPSSARVSVSETFENLSLVENLDDSDNKEERISKNGAVSVPRWTCNTCKSEFESLLDQRSHFKSDIHRINVKLSIAGKNIVNEEDFDELTSDSLKDFDDISSISGSEDEADKVSSLSRNDIQSKQKLFVQLQTGERISLWKCLILNESENICYESDKVVSYHNDGFFVKCLSERAVIERFGVLIHEPRDNLRLRIVLLVSGGHFAGCVFDGNSVVVHKTFHRYVVRAKAGKKQSSKDAGGRAAHSAGASLRRYNELALKKDIQELLAAWKAYFDASSCIFIYAPSSNRHLLFDGEKAYFSHQHSAVRNIPLNVRRPTFKEARRIYNQLTQVAYELDDQEVLPDAKDDLVVSASTIADGSQESIKEDFKDTGPAKASLSHKKSDEKCLSSESESEVIGITTPLHEAVQSGNANKVLELLELGLDPCVKDERGRTPYGLANDKEVRNTFRRFMASNLDRWDWHAANVPSALTKEMEESQAAKQAEKDAKRKARAKELKKLRKTREKKSQAEETSSHNTAVVAQNQATAPSVNIKHPQPGGRSLISDEELKRVQAMEREKRAAAAEKRMAAAASVNAQRSSTSTATVPAAQPKSGLGDDIICSCCNTSLAGKVPFHRYNYKYCSTTCMHVHREMLEDG